MEMSEETGRDGAEMPRLSHWEVERFLRGELPPGDSERIRARMRAEPEFALWMDSMGQEAPARSFGDLRRKIRAGAPGETEEAGARLIGRILAALWAKLSAPRPAALAFGALVLAAGVIVSHRPRSPAPLEAMTGKGGAGMEIRLIVRDRVLAPDSLQSVAGGDTLLFWYRSPDSLHFQFWYREDGTSPEPFRGASASAASWPPAQRWTGPAKRALLEGNWSRQDIFVLASECRLDPEQARALIQGGQAPCRTGIVRYHLIRRTE